jgi:hypothetical protein
LKRQLATFTRPEAIARSDFGPERFEAKVFKKCPGDFVFGVDDQRVGRDLRSEGLI